MTCCPRRRTFGVRWAPVGRKTAATARAGFGLSEQRKSAVRCKLALNCTEGRQPSRRMKRMDAARLWFDIYLHAIGRLTIGHVPGLVKLPHSLTGPIWVASGRPFASVPVDERRPAWRQIDKVVHALFWMIVVDLARFISGGIHARYRAAGGGTMVWRHQEAHSPSDGPAA